MSTSNFLAITLLAASQSSKYVTVNDAINALAGAIASPFTQAMADADQTLATTDAYGNLVFKCTGADTADRNLIVPSGAGSNKLYVVENSTTGGHNIVVKTASGTGVTIPSSAGLVLVYCDGTNVVAVGAGGSGATAFTGLSDVPGSYSGAGGKAVQVNAGATGLEFDIKPFDVSTFLPGVPTSSQKMVRVPIARAVTFPAGASGSYAKAGTAATSSTTFTLSKNGSSFATAVFASSGTVATWTQASDAVFAAGDVLEIDAPGTADATLADIGITLAGVRA